MIFARFAAAPKKLPASTNFWPKRSGFPIRTFGNTRFGNCTRAKQAIAAMRMERIECRRTPSIADDEVIRVYQEMTKREYGGGDVGAYETDALSAWRDPEESFRDTKGRALTIDAYVRLDPFDHEQLRAALVAAGAHGLAVCFNLPAAWQGVDPPEDWDVAGSEAMTGIWEPGSWGGHSSWATDYDERGLWIEHTWGLKKQRVTWRGCAAYMDEAHLVIDSLDYWRKKKPEAKRLLDLAGIKDAVNRVSSLKIP